MYKSELTKALIGRLAENYPQMTASAVKESVDMLIKYIVEVLLKGRRLEIRGFGAFGLRRYPACTVTNPKTGETLHLPPRYRLRFRPSKKLKLRLNAGYR